MRRNQIKHPRIVRDADGRVTYCGYKLPLGPWNDEPDFAEFVFDGFPCVLNRNNMGAWCGYVGVPEGHPWYCVGYDDIGADVHGGLTYAEGHVPGTHADSTWEVGGVSQTLWWVGFDCIHSGDLSLSDVQSGSRDGEYRTAGYAKIEVMSLAKQALAVVPN